MEPNTYCGCGNVPSKYCSCLKPSKTFLCDQCIGPHVSKSGAHSVFPIDAGDIFDVDLLNCRRKAATEGTIQVEKIMQMVRLEWEAVPGVVQGQYQQYCLEIWRYYEKAQAEVGAIYQEMWEVLEKTKNELKALGTELNISLSAETLAVLRICSHPEREFTAWQDVPSLVQRVVSGETVGEQRKISAKWACSDVECDSCIKKLKELCLKDCPALSSKERAVAAVLADDVNVSADAWKCPREGCGQMHWKTEKSCSCGYQNLSLVESRILAEEEEKSIPAASPAPAVSVSRLVWVCPLCTYNSNPIYMAKCQICYHPKPESERKEEISRVEAQTWRCPKCGRDCAVGTKKCFCGYSSEPQQSHQLPSQKSVSEFWTCPSCHYGRNIESYTYCSGCQLKRIKEETYPNAYGPAMAAQVFPSFPGQSHAGQPESQVSRQAAGGKTHEICLRCTYSNPVGQKCICWICSNCGLASRGNTCTRCGTPPKPSLLCRICHKRVDESGLCKSCAARNGRQEPKGFCLECQSMICTVHQ